MAIAVWSKVDGENVAHALGVVRQQLNAVEHEVILDFSLVSRLDPSALRAMEELAKAATDKEVKVGLRGVNIDVYKVIKLVKLTPRFFFVT